MPKAKKKRSAVRSAMAPASTYVAPRPAYAAGGLMPFEPGPEWNEQQARDFVGEYYRQVPDERGHPLQWPMHREREYPWINPHEVAAALAAQHRQALANMAMVGLRPIQQAMY